MSGSINLFGPSTNAGAPVITPAAINTAVNAALVTNGNTASTATSTERTRALAAEASLNTAITNEQTRATAAEGAIIPGVPASTVLPVIDTGAGAIGTMLTYARADHAHPTDTSRYAANNPAGFQTAANVTTSLGPYLTQATATATYSTPASVASAVAAGAGYGAMAAGAISAAGTDFSTATPLTQPASVITTVAAGTGVILPSQYSAAIVNRGANTLTVYPPAGGTIEGATSATIVAGGSAQFVSSNSLTFFAF